MNSLKIQTKETDTLDDRMRLWIWIKHTKKFANREPSSFLTIEQTDLQGAWYKRYQHEFNFQPTLLSLYVRHLARGLL